MKKLFLSLFLLILLLGLFACEKPATYDIYASIYPIEYLAKRIAKEQLSVGSSYPRGADVHEYEPPANQIVRMSKSKILFYIGAGLEGFLGEAKQSVFENSGCELVELSQYISLINFGDIEHVTEHDHLADPHIWLDPLRMVSLAEVIRDKLILIDPKNAASYIDNADEVISELYQLDSSYEQELNNPEYSSKTILVDHDAYVYWEERYGISRIHTRIENHSCEIIPSEFNRNLELISQMGIKYIVVTKNESICPVVNQYILQANLELASIHSLATITKKEEESGLDYFKIMYDNLEVLKKVLPSN